MQHKSDFFMFDIPNGRFMKQSKQHILSIAFSLFLHKCFKDVTLKEIVKETGLSKGAFYHHFISKEQLFFEVVDTFYLQVMLVDYQKLNHNSLWDFYHDYISHVQNSIRDFRRGLNTSNSNSSIDINYITLMFDAMKLFPGFKEKLIVAQNDELNAWIKIVKISREKGEFSSPMTDEQIARMFVYSNDGIGLRLLIEGKLDNATAEMLTLWDNFYKEIKD